MRTHGHTAKAVFTIALAVLLVVVSACEPSIEIKVSNQTATTLKVFFADAFIGEVSSEAEITFAEPVIFSPFIVSARDNTGNEVYTTNFTREDMVGKKTYRVVIPPTAIRPAFNSGNATER